MLCVDIDPVSQLGAQSTISPDVAGATSKRSVVTPVPQAAGVALIEGLKPHLHASPGSSHVAKHVHVKGRGVIDAPPQTRIHLGLGRRSRALCNGFDEVRDGFI